MLDEADMREQYRRVVLGEVEGHQLLVASGPECCACRAVDRGDYHRFAANGRVVPCTRLFYCGVLAGAVISPLRVSAGSGRVLARQRHVDRFLVPLFAVQYNGGGFVVVAFAFRLNCGVVGEFCLRSRAYAPSG